MGADEGAGAGEAAGSSPGAPESPVAPDTGRAGEGSAGPAGAKWGPEEVSDVAARAFHRADSRAMATSNGGEAGNWGLDTGGSPGPVGARVASAGAAGSSFRWRR